MSYPVTYYCPHCGTLVALEREGYLADRSVTPYPLEGWTYVAPTEPFDAEAGDDDADDGEDADDAVEADGVRFVCGESDGVDWDPHDGVRGTDVGGDEPYREPDADGVGCGEAFYLSFVRFEEGREIDPAAESEPVAIDPDPRPSGPRGPSGPGEAGGPSDSDGGFW
ncbi:MULTISPECIES: hypothetical protein [unclassified Halorubrum]|uniref:hypothetical protein n=1 Tax=unclassified Halorubrum TaxID=2642239 RepID=UPI0010F45FD3|nr:MULTISPECIES: hypothetical protein [unclassified Halorubrum]TKX42479.1 hypothetical protein EXE50_13585 [Halorubrum sp. ARQ200]TKX49868.1 hypothetical protein EXE49_08685 [Halorubrum sp. ASP121]